MKLKPYLLLLMLGLFLVTSCSEDGLSPRDIPTDIMTDFNQRHPDATKIEWEREGDLWEAEFVENGVEVGILYDANFNWVRTEWEISIGELPAAAMTYINTTYPGGKLDEAEYFESASEGNGYIAEVEEGKLEYEIFFDLDGNYLRHEEEKAD